MIDLTQIPEFLKLGGVPGVLCVVIYALVRDRRSLLRTLERKSIALTDCINSKTEIYKEILEKAVAERFQK